MRSLSRFRFYPVILGLLVSWSVAHALPVRFLPWDDLIAARKIGFNDGVQTTELQNLHPDKRTKPLNWTSGEIPPQLVALDRNSEDGKPVAIPVKLTSGMKSPLVIILPDPANPSGLRAFVIEDSSASFAWGSLRFINATGKELLVRKDKAIKTLPTSWAPVDIDPGGGESRNMGIQMAARDDLTAILYSSVWEYDPNIRKLIIVIPGKDAGKGALDLKIIPEDRRTATPATPPAEP